MGETASQVASSESSTQTQAGARVHHRYRLDELLAKGGAGEIYKAYDEHTRSVVALKRIRRGRDTDKLVPALEREFETLSRLSHPRIIEVYDFGLDDGLPYYTMELLEGHDLRELAPLGYRETCRILRDVASSLALLHAQQVIHRDVSPRNVRLERAGRYAKLIDFGALTGFGPVSNVVGTPACIPPEAINEQHLDGRSDLYALGGVAYWALTGRHAYPAKRLDDLRPLWDKRPLVPSELADDVPAALDELVMALLSLDPAGRPPSASAVIDELTRIANLPEEGGEGIASAYLVSGTLIGRDGVVDLLRKRTKRLTTERGASVLLEGGPGTGKSRLLHELGYHARRIGAVHVQIDGSLAQGPKAIEQACVRALLDGQEPAVREVLRRRAPTLAWAEPAVAEALHVEPAPHPDDPLEQRQALVDAVVTTLEELATHVPMVLSVDDAHRLDRRALGLIGHLAKRAKGAGWLMVTVLSTSAEVPDPLRRALRHASSRAKLKDLSEVQTIELVEQTFGSVPNVTMLGQWLYQCTGGNPLHCREVMRYLAERGIVQYTGGRWRIPETLADDALPASLDEALRKRIELLEPRACNFAEALSVSTRPLSFELCLALAEGHDAEQVERLLDVLVEHGVLTVSGEHYLMSDPMRALLQARLTEDRKRALLKSLGNTLAEQAGDDHVMRIDAGIALVSAGDEDRGMQETTYALAQLSWSGERLDKTAEGAEMLVPIVERRRAQSDLAALLSVLAAAGYGHDHRYADKYGDRAIDLSMKITGLRWGVRLQRFLGRKLGLIVGIVAGFLCYYLWWPRTTRTPSPEGRLGFREAFMWMINAIAPTAAVTAIRGDLAHTRAIRERLAPLRVFGRSHPFSATYSLVRTFELAALGDDATTQTFGYEWINRWERPGSIAQTPDSARIQFLSGARYVVALVTAARHDDRALSDAKRLEATGLGRDRATAAVVRTVYHANRGEAELASEYERQAESEALAAGGAWHMWARLKRHLIGPYWLTGDSHALGRCVDSLERQANDHMIFPHHVDYARAAQLSARGQHEDALPLYRQLLHTYEPNACIHWKLVHAGLARTLNALGRHEEAYEVATNALSYIDMTSPERDLAAFHVELERQLAFAEAGLGRHDDAVERLKHAIAALPDEPNPLVAGLLHRGRAELALQASDEDTAIYHVHRAQQHFQLTRNPALLRPLQWLMSQTRHGRGFNYATGESDASDESSVMTQVGRPTRRIEEELKLLLSTLTAEQGWLFVQGDDENLSLRANGGDERDPDEVQELAQSTYDLARDHLAHQDDEETTGANGSGRTEGNQEGDLRAFPLMCTVEGQPSIVGVLVLRPGVTGRNPDRGWLSTLARAVASGTGDTETN